MKNANDQSQKGLSKYMVFLMYLAVAILLNIVLNTLPPIRADLTKNKLFTISRASSEAVGSLQEPMTVKIYYTDDLQVSNRGVNYNSVKQYIKDLMVEYATHSPNHYFSSEFIDVGNADDDSLTDEIRANQEEAEKYGINAQTLDTSSSSSRSFQKAYMGMVFIHGDVVETLSPIGSSNGLEYQITYTIQKLSNKVSALLALEDTINVQLFLSRELKQYTDIADKAKKVKEVVDGLNKATDNRFVFSEIDPTSSPQKAQEYNAYSIRIDQEGNRAYADLFIEYKGKRERIKFLEIFNTVFGSQVDMPDDDALEKAINDSVAVIIGINDKIGYLTSNDTFKLQSSQLNPQTFQQNTQDTYFKMLLDATYTVTDVNLGKEEIPPGIECLVIADPKGDFTDYQLYQIDQFLMSGKSLAIFLPGMKIEEYQGNEAQFGGQMPPRFVPLQTGLEALLESYGLTLGSSQVMDEKGYEDINQSMGKIVFYNAPNIQNDKLNQKLPYYANLKGLIFFQSSPITIEDKIQNSKEFSWDVIVSSSDKSWEEKNPPVDLSQFAGGYFPSVLDKDKKSYPLAVQVEGTFSSYFEGKPIPEQPARDTEGEESGTSISLKGEARKPFVSQDKKGRIVLIGSTGILENNFLGNPSNQSFILNILDWANNKEDFAIMRSKLQTYNPLNETNPQTKNLIQYFNAIGIPLVVAVLGILVFVGRNSRKKRLQAEFSRNFKKEEEV